MECKQFYIIFLVSLIFNTKNVGQIIDTTLQFQLVEITASRFQSFQTGIKKTTFNEFQKLSTNTQNLGTALSWNTPIYIKDYGQGRLATTTVRGASAAQTAVVWNGFSLNNPMLGQVDFSLIPTFFLDEIGVQYGSNSTSWGSGAVGASIILENKNNFKQGWKAEWQSKTGSFQHFFNGVSTSFSNATFSTTTKGFFQSAKNDFPIKNGQSEKLPHSALQKWGILQKNGFKLNDKQQINFNLWYQKADRDLPPNLLQQVSAAEQTDEFLRTTLHWKYIGKDHVLQLRNGLFYEYLWFQDPIATIDSRSRTWTNRSEIEWRKTINTQNKLNVGGNYAYLKAISTGFGTTNPSQTRLAFFAMYQWQSLSKELQLQVSLRQVWNDKEKVPLLPAIGFTKYFSKKFLLRGNVAKSYRVPTFNDLFWQHQGNRNLLPESGWNEELGMTYRPVPNWQFSTTTYNRTIKNWIAWQPENGVWRPNNLQQVWSKGLETRLQWQKSFQDLKVNFIAQYDMTFSTQQKENTAFLNKQLIYVPKHKFNFNLQAEWLDWTFAFYHQFTGKVYTLADNSAFLPAYHLNHFFINKKVEIKQLGGAFFFRINNIFGVSYQVIAQFPMPMRHYEVGWKVGF